MDSCCFWFILFLLSTIDSCLVNKAEHLFACLGKISRTMSSGVMKYTNIFCLYFQLTTAFPLSKNTLFYSIFLKLSKRKIEFAKRAFKAVKYWQLSESNKDILSSLIQMFEKAFVSQNIRGMNRKKSLHDVENVDWKPSDYKEITTKTKSANILVWTQVCRSLLGLRHDGQP